MSCGVKPCAQTRHSLWRALRRVHAPDRRTLEDAWPGGSKEARTVYAVAASLGPGAPQEPSPGDREAAQDLEGSQHPEGAEDSTCDGPSVTPEPRGQEGGAEEAGPEEGPLSSSLPSSWQGLVKPRRFHAPEQRIEMMTPPQAEPWVLSKILGSGDSQAELLRMAAEITGAAEASEPDGQCSWQPDSERTEASDDVETHDL